MGESIEGRGRWGLKAACWLPCRRAWRRHSTQGLDGVSCLETLSLGSSWFAKTLYIWLANLLCCQLSRGQGSIRAGQALWYGGRGIGPFLSRAALPFVPFGTLPAEKHAARATAFNQVLVAGGERSAFEMQRPGGRDLFLPSPPSPAWPVPEHGLHTDGGKWRLCQGSVTGRKLAKPPGRAWPAVPRSPEPWGAVSAFGTFPFCSSLLRRIISCDLCLISQPLFRQPQGSAPKAQSISFCDV